MTQVAAAAATAADPHAALTSGSKTSMRVHSAAADAPSTANSNTGPRPRPKTSAQATSGEHTTGPRTSKFSEPVAFLADVLRRSATQNKSPEELVYALDHDEQFITNVSALVSCCCLHNCSMLILG